MTPLFLLYPVHTKICKERTRKVLRKKKKKEADELQRNKESFSGNRILILPTAPELRARGTAKREALQDQRALTIYASPWEHLLSDVTRRLAVHGCCCRDAKGVTVRCVGAPRLAPFTRHQCPRASKAATGRKKKISESAARPPSMCL